jgi:streptogramin lyase
VITEFPVPTADASLIGIAADLEGNIWFAEHRGHKIGRLTP